MSAGLVLLALLMGLVTYPSRAIPLLAPGIERLRPGIVDYLRLVGPAVLAALAAVNTVLTVDADRRASIHVGVEWLAVALCVGVVAMRRSLLLGLVLGAGLVAVLRASGLATTP